MKQINATLTVRANVQGFGPYSRIKITLAGDNLEEDKADYQLISAADIREKTMVLTEKLIDLLNATIDLGGDHSD